MPWKKVTKICLICKKQFTTNRKTKFCSIQCVGKYHSLRPRFPNEPTKTQLTNLYYKQNLGAYQIANKLNIPVTCIQRRMKQFNIKLRPQTLAQKVAAKMGRARTGPKHPWWKGGRKYRKNGYNELLRPNHPRANYGYVPEHIIVWEEYHQKTLPSNWVIHHLNGVKNDNRIENLKAMPKGKHSSWLIIKELQSHIKKLEAHIKKLEK